MALLRLLNLFLGAGKLLNDTTFDFGDWKFVLTLVHGYFINKLMVLLKRRDPSKIGH